MSSYKHLLSQLAMPVLVAAAAAAVAATLMGGSWPKSLMNKSKSLPSSIGQAVSRIFNPSGPSGPSSAKGGSAFSGNPSDTYSAVYLTGGKVYFGILEKSDSVEPLLKDVFYLTLGAAKDEFRLNKLTGQDNPANELTLSRDHILYWEPLEPDSKVVQGIEEFHKQEK